MEILQISALAEECAQGFGLHLASLQVRHKKSILSIRKKGREIRISFNTAAEKFDEEPMRALLFTTMARCAKMTESPKYQFYKDALNTYQKTGYFAEKCHPIKECLKSPKGVSYDLENLRSVLIQEYRLLFGTYFDTLPPIIGWTNRKSYRRMGFYEQTRNMIGISRSLDSPEVPPFAIKYVIFHELLHAFLGGKKVKKRTRVHHAQFKELERFYPENDRANLFLRVFAQRLRTGT